MKPHDSEFTLEDYSENCSKTQKSAQNTLQSNNLSKESEKSRVLGDIGAITAIPSERDQILSEMVQSLQSASIQQSIINTVVNNLTSSLSVTGGVVDIQTLSPSGDQIVRGINAAKTIFNFKFPEPNKPDNIFSEFQRAQSEDLLVRVKYIPGKENLIKSIEVYASGWS